VSFSDTFPSLVFASYLFRFWLFFHALLGAFVRFGFPFGDHFAFIFRSLNDVFPNMICASIFNRFWDGFWTHFWCVWDCFLKGSADGSFYESMHRA
jgi:hypothetical protein